VYSAVAKPNFCQKCGNKFAGASATDLPQEEDEDEITNIPDMDGLEVEIDIRGPNTEQISKLAGQRASNKKIKIDNRPGMPSDIDPIKELEREASALRKKT
jgi:hypothetical protein